MSAVIGDLVFGGRRLRLGIGGWGMGGVLSLQNRMRAMQRNS